MVEFASVYIEKYIRWLRHESISRIRVFQIKYQKNKFKSFLLGCKNYQF